MERKPGKVRSKSNGLNHEGMEDQKLVSIPWTRSLEHKKARGLGFERRDEILGCQRPLDTRLLLDGLKPPAPLSRTINKPAKVRNGG
jgi:hypothetical protein